MLDRFIILKANTLGVFLLFVLTGVAQSTSEILDTLEKDKVYLPDFSYAGYHYGKKKIANPNEKTTLKAIDYGVIPNDGLDDSNALIKLLEKANKIEGDVFIELPAGRIILSEILYFERSHIIFSGQGAAENGTEIFCPRPMMYLENPDSLVELREYLKGQNKIQNEKENNIYLPFSQYSWSGGFLWTQVPGKRVKPYMEKYDTPLNVLGKINKASRGTKVLEVMNHSGLNEGAVVEIQWYNKKGEKGSLLKELYGDTSIYMGSHHWDFPNLPLVRQQVKIEKIEGDKVTIASPLLINVVTEYATQIVEWKHLEEVGFQHFKITFPYSNRIAHHVEQGYNAMYLTSLFNGWVKDVVIDNADSGILTESIANVSICDIITTGEKKAHYSVQMGGVHNVLVKNLSVENNVLHPLSFNTFASKNVYTECEIFKNPVLDQHSGANHQNLFDKIRVHINTNEDVSYPLFVGGGAKYWKPSHGNYNTFWNIEVLFLNQFNKHETVLLQGMKDGPNARLLGVHGNSKIKVNYEPNAYINFTNSSMKALSSLYKYQLKDRLDN